METFWQDVKHGARVLLKSPGFSAVAILSLALGIGANTTIFTVVNAILLHPLPVKDISRLVEADTIDAKTKVGFANAAKLGMSFSNFQDYQRQNEVFAGLACIISTPLTWSGGTEPRQVNGQMVSANYFEVLGIQPAVGRFFAADEDTKPSGNNLAVVSYSFWCGSLWQNGGLRERQRGMAKRELDVWGLDFPIDNCCNIEIALIDRWPGALS